MNERTILSRRGFLHAAAASALIAGGRETSPAKADEAAEARFPVGPLDLKAGTERWTDDETKRTVRRITPPALDATGLYHHQRAGNSIHVMRTDGSDRRRVAEGGGHHFWSPDGDFIFHNDEWSHPAPWSHWRWDRRAGTREEVLPASEWNFHFCSKPGGRELVGDGMWSDGFINHYRLAGKGKWRKTRLCKRITDNLRTEDQARFAPDYQSVFFNGNVKGISAIFQVDAGPTTGQQG